MRFEPTNRRFEFHKSGQLFIRSHNEALTVAAMCVSNPDRAPARIQGCDAAPTPTGFAKRIRRAAQFQGGTVKEFVTHSIMEMVRTLEEDMILFPRTGKPICDIGDLEWFAGSGD